MIVSSIAKPLYRDIHDFQTKNIVNGMHLRHTWGRQKHCV